MFEFCNSNQSAEPVKHGHWIYHDRPALHWKNQCSHCNSWAASDTRYCAFCGCKMDEEVRNGNT